MARMDAAQVQPRQQSPSPTSRCARGALLWLLLVWSVGAVGTAPAEDEPPVYIGVLNDRGTQATLERWAPTAAYLWDAIFYRRFEIVPLAFDEIEPAVRFGQVDFLLTNPGLYVTLERRYGLTRIATLYDRVNGASYNRLGGVIFSRADRADLQELRDLRGRSFVAVDARSLGGFQMAWDEFQRVGITPERDLRLEFAGTHDGVVRAVLAGEADAGTVRTDILERMAAQGLIRLDEVRILNPRSHANFFLAHSTELYPEWPFSKLQHTDATLAQKVVVALLSMRPDDPAAIHGDYAGWSVPLDYEPVHELYKRLRLPPYQDWGRFTLAQVMERYAYWVVAGISMLLALLVLTLWGFRLNRQLQRAKARLEEQHELILNSVAEGIYGVDRGGNSTFINRAMEEMTGWRADEIIGHNQHAILHHTRADGTPHPAKECPVYLTYQDSRPRFVEEDVFWRKDGTSFPVQYSTTPIRDDEGRTMGSVVVFRDIGARKRAEEEARQHQMDLAHVGRLSTMGEMASGIAHELNQPLAAIATNAHAGIRMIESGTVAHERIADVLERVASQARRAGEIIRQLRRFVRKEQPERSLADINQLVRESEVLIRPEARKAGVEIRMELAEGLPEVLVQPIQIEQVILNLCRNAIEAMADLPPEAPRAMTITTVMGGANGLIVQVQDTGPGLNPAVRDKLFTPFITTKPKGMGLGLSISHGIIAAHEGMLYPDLASTQGTVFRFVLPIQGEP